MADNETIADIIAEKRRQADKIERNCAEMMKRGKMISDSFACELVADIRREADRLEAAIKREKTAIEADALEVGGIVEAARKRKLSKNVSKNGADFGQLGDAAKLREALKHIKDRLPHMLQYMRVYWEDASAGGYFDELMLVIDAALSAPPRNCDKYSHDEALRIWSAESENPMNGCFDVWLFAPATEQEGGNK